MVLFHLKISWSSKLEQFHILCMEQDAIGGTIDLNDIICLPIQSGVKGNNWINDMEQNAIDGLPQLEEQLTWNDIIDVFRFNWESKETMISNEFC